MKKVLIEQGKKQVKDLRVTLAIEAVKKKTFSVSTGIKEYYNIEDAEKDFPKIVMFLDDENPRDTKNGKPNPAFLLVNVNDFENSIEIFEVYANANIMSKKIYGVKPFFHDDQRAFLKHLRTSDPAAKEKTIKRLKDADTEKKIFKEFGSKKEAVEFIAQTRGHNKGREFNALALGGTDWDYTDGVYSVENNDIYTMFSKTGRTYGKQEEYSVLIVYPDGSYRTYLVEAGKRSGGGGAAYL